MKKEKEQEKFAVKKNNYIGLLFFALVLASTLYIIKHETDAFLDLKEKSIIEEETKNINPNQELIDDLRLYLNQGDINTNEIYQSMYIYNETTTANDFNDASALYTAYKYINQTSDIISKIRDLTCEEAESLNINNIQECNPLGTESLSSYKVNSYITKNMLKSTIRKIFNRNITEFPDFYINSEDKCYSLEDIYLCVIHQEKDPEAYTETSYITSTEDKNTITITESYKYINTGITYKGFNSNEVGEGKYKSTFKKQNGSYYWVSTEYIDN